MTAVISPPMFFQFVLPNGVAAGYKLFTYAAGTSTKQATYTDSSAGTPMPNPIPLDANGAASFWLDPTKGYKYVLSPPNDSDPPASPVYTQDNIYGPVNAAILTQAFVGAILYPRTTAEIAASVTPTAYQYPAGDLRRYGGVGDDATDNATPIASAFAQMQQSGGATVYFPPGVYRTSQSLPTVSISGWTARGDDWVVTRIKFTGAVNGFVVNGRYGKMSGLWLDGTGVGKIGIVYWNTAQCIFKDVVVQNFTTDGANVNETFSTPTGNCNATVIVDCLFNTNTGVGFRILEAGSDQNSFEMRGVGCSGNTSHGMIIRGFSHRLIGGLFEGNGGYGIKLGEDTDVSSTLNNIIWRPYIESNVSGGVYGGALSVKNEIVIDNLNVNSGYTRHANAEDDIDYVTNASGPTRHIGDVALHFLLQSVKSGGNRLQLTGDGTDTNIQMRVMGKGNGGLWLESLNDSGAGTVTIGQQGSGIKDVIFGSTTFAAATTATASLGVTLPASTYKIVIAPNANKTFWWSSKTTTQFTLNASGSSSDTVDWMVIL